MDPNTVLAQIRQIIAAHLDTLNEEVTDATIVLDYLLFEQLIIAVGNLDDWLSKGGFLPSVWQHDPEVDSEQSMTTRNQAPKASSYTQQLLNDIITPKIPPMPGSKGGVS